MLLSKESNIDINTQQFFKKNFALLGRGLILILTLVGIGLLIKLVGINHLLQTEWLDQQIRGQGLNGIILFLLIGSVVTAIGFPRQLLSFASGYAFGFIFGTGLALFASINGAIITFQYARFMGQNFLIKRFPQPIKKIDHILSQRTVIMTLILRLSPFTNNLATNLAAGISSVKSLPFFISSILGYLPQTLIFALLGSGFNIDPYMRTLISILLFVISTVLGAGLWYHYRRSLAAEFHSAIHNS